MQFLGAFKGSRLHAPCVLAVTTGMRQGELMGLHWSDIDLKADSLSVRFTLGAIAGKLQ
jgi:integrase